MTHYIVEQPTVEPLENHRGTKPAELCYSLCGYFLSLSIQVMVSVIRFKCHVHTTEGLKGWGGVNDHHPTGISVRHSFFAGK